jgi:hypothetical protein
MITRNSLQKKSFSSTTELAQHMEAFVSTYNKTARPFVVWKKRKIISNSRRKNLYSRQIDKNAGLGVDEVEFILT